MLCEKFFPVDAVNNPAALKNCLDSLTAGYDGRFLDSDPAAIVHRYASPSDIEVAGFVVSSLAYGNAAQIRKSADDIFARIGTAPSWFARDLALVKALETFRGFKHRWTTGSDVALLFCIIGRALDEEGSLGTLVQKLDNPGEKTIEGLLARLSGWMRTRLDSAFAGRVKRTTLSYFVPSPAQGSACKRLAMFFRWMVRGPDGVDFGLWKFIDPARLVIPLDSHIARMAKLLDLCSRRNPDWKMALQITETLRRLDPDDPVRYDFALVRPGILRECTATKRGDCSSCLLRDVCMESSV